MVRVTHAQARGDADPVPHRVEEVDAIRALQMLVCEHISYCEVFSVVPRERIVLHSSFRCGMTHEKIYEGSEQEMESLFRALYFLAFNVTDEATHDMTTVDDVLRKTRFKAWALEEGCGSMPDLIDDVNFFLTGTENALRSDWLYTANWLAICAVSPYFKSAPFVGWKRDRVAIMVAVGISTADDVDGSAAYLRLSEPHFMGMARFIYERNCTVRRTLELNQVKFKRAGDVMKVGM